MAKKSLLATNIEYFALRVFCGIVNCVPYKMAMAMASFFAFFAFYVLGLKRKRTIDRIKSVFPEKTGSQVRRIAWKSLSNILQTGVEMIRSPYLTKSWMDKYVFEGQYYKDKLQSYVDEGKGVVIMVPHSGNWYMAAWSMAKYGLKLFALAANQKNAKIDAWMKRQYGDIEVLDRSSRDTLAKIKNNLQIGRAFAILPDLRVPKKDVEVDFLNSKANVSHAGAMFAVHASSPIVVAAMSRENGKHKFNHLATIRPDGAATDKRQEACRLTKEVMAHIDEFIKTHPEDWFWYNKRWILQPVAK
jgi:KDO2-lipid IV(A) lauroyltransferase